MNDTMISVEGLTKTFHKNNSTKSIKQILISIFSKKNRIKKDKSRFLALDNISFEVRRGEFFGIVGRNGSGKSTLLKLLAGVYVPTAGSTTINGTLTPFIELGVGFNPELSGKDNVYLNAALMGFSRKETAFMYDEIVGFAELEEFMDEKLKNYSSGMQVRLAFSIAIKSKSDVLLIDEVLAVGDTAFQHKCINYFRRVKKEGRTVVFVTHDMSSVERFCDRVLVLDKSKYVGIFTPKLAAKKYQEINAISELDSKEVVKLDSKKAEAIVRLIPNLIRKIRLEGDTRKPVVCGQPLSIHIDLANVPEKKQLNDALVSMAFYDDSGSFVAAIDSDKIRCSSDTKKLVATMKYSPFVSGKYRVFTQIYQKDANDDYIIVDADDKGVAFISTPPNGGEGSGQLFLDSSWEKS